MRYQFLIDLYETEITKVLSVWSMFDDADLRVRPHSSDTRGRSLLEHIAMLQYGIHSTYSPTADTGGLFLNHAPTLYAYPDQTVLLAEEADVRHKASLPGPVNLPCTERPER